MKLPVLVAADNAPWEALLVTATERRDCAVTVTRRCVDIVELLAMATAGQGKVAVVSSTLRRLDADAVDRLLAVDVVPVAVVPRDDAGAEAGVRALGIRHVVPDDADPEVVVSVVQVAAEGQAAASERPSALSFGLPGTASTADVLAPGVAADVLAAGGRASGVLAPGVLAPGQAPEPPAALGRRDRRRGGVIAVWGPTGAPGRTTVAVNLADALARQGASTLLVDAEVYGATVATVLGLLDESPGLAAACRQSTTAQFDTAKLVALCWQLSPTLRVLTGVPIAARWPELRPAGVEAVLNTARDLAEHTVVDCGFSLETDEEISFDTVAPRRNGATLAVLNSADVILAVGSADPVGVQRLVRGLAELRDLHVPAQVFVVLNRVRAGVVPGDTARELSAALERFAGARPIAFLPYDLDSIDAALVAGRLLAEVRSGSPLRAAVDALAAKLTGAPQHGRRPRIPRRSRA